MKRFTLYTANESATAELVESDSGGWVRWEDACLAIQKAYNLGFAEGSSKRDGDGNVVWCANRIYEENEP